MRILLVWPKGFDTNFAIPLPLGYLKSNLNNKKHEVKILDCSLKNISSKSKELKEVINNFKPQLIGVSCWSNTYEEAINIIKVTKSIDKNIITVIGGIQPTSDPSIIKEEKVIDFLFRGESELSFAQFIKELEKKKPNWSKVKGLTYCSNNGTIIKNTEEREKDLDKIKIPDYDAININEYLRKGYKWNTSHKYNAPIWLTRGCPYKCSFCSVSLQNGTLLRSHSIEYAIKWVKYLYKKGIRHINIIDDNFTFDVEYAKKFCKEIIKLNLKNLHFGTPNCIRVERTDTELFRLMKKAGWEKVVIAPESGSIKTLKRMRKNIDPSIIPQKVKEIKRARLKVHGAFILGFPGETPEDIKKTLKLLRKCKFNFFFLNNFQPLPGTPIYNELIEKGEISNKLLPKDYSSGERAYTPKELKNFNFPLLILREYLYLALSNPLNIPHMITIFNPKLIIKKVYYNIKNI